MPRIGPSEGSRSAIITLWPARARESASPTVVVDLPSPAGVGDIAETSTTLPGARGGPPAVEPASFAGSIFALYRPWKSRASALIPAAAAISSIGRIVARCAISRSLSAVAPAAAVAGTAPAVAAGPGIVVSDIVVLWLVASVGVPASDFRPLLPAYGSG